MEPALADGDRERYNSLVFLSFNGKSGWSQGGVDRCVPIGGRPGGVSDQHFRLGTGCLRTPFPSGRMFLRLQIWTNVSHGNAKMGQLGALAVRWVFRFWLALE